MVTLWNLNFDLIPIKHWDKKALKNKIYRQLNGINTVSRTRICFLFILNSHILEASS